VASQLFGWRVLFAGSLVLALLLIPFARRALPDGNSGGERRFDLAGGLLLGLGAGLLLFGVTRGQGAGFSSSAPSAASTAFRWSLVMRDSPTSCSVSDSREI
jgi:predicted MFS family arabinose efflux permease